MKDRDIERMLKCELKSITPDVLPKVMESEGALPSKKKEIYKRPAFLTAAVSFILVLAIGLGSIPFFTNSGGTPNVILNDGGSVYMDINPSVQFSIDKNKNVTAVCPLNDDGKLVIKGLTLVGKHVDFAAGAVLENAAKLGFIDVGGRKNAVLISASLIEAEKEKELQKELQKGLQGQFKSKGIYGVVITDSKTLNVKKQAESLGITESKMRLVLSAESIGVTGFDPKTVSISELNKLIEDRIDYLEDFEFSEEIEEALENLEDGLEERLEEMLESFESIFEDIEQLLEDSDMGGEELEQIFEELEEALEELSELEAGESAEKYLDIIDSQLIKLEEIESFSGELKKKVNELSKEVRKFKASYENIRSEIEREREKILREYSKLLKDNEEKYLSHKKSHDFDDDFEKWLKENRKSYEDDWEGMKLQNGKD